ncbi:MAG TPA: hypothetical protein VMV31_06360 [Terriglobales bacterium]|nr:hypothetical protein [Terriglobales bacterium]
MADYNFLLETRLSQDQQLALQILQRVCRGAGLNVYLTGGPMRDLLAGQPVRFLNCTTEGDPVGLAAKLQAEGAERLSAQAEQHSLNFGLRGCRMRLAAAGAGAGTIVEDLRGRGLTLNSIGLSLNPGSRGLPLDPTNGAADIEARLIRMNHPYVFLEEPIVLLRAVRLATRLQFALEERTQARMQSAREGNYVAQATPVARGQELEAIAYDPDPAAVLRALEKEQWLEAAFGKGIRTNKMNLGGLSRLTATVESWEQLGLTVDVGLVAMALLLGGLAPADQSRLAKLVPSRHLGTEWKKVVGEAEALEKRLLALPSGGAAPWLRRAQEAIEKALPEGVVYASLEPSNARAGKKLKEFQAQALQLRQRLPLGVLRGLGLAPHSLEAEELLRPWYRRLLNGEGLTEAELAEGLRAAVAATRPAPAAPAAPPLGRAGKAARGASPAAAPPPAPAPEKAVDKAAGPRSGKAAAPAKPAPAAAKHAPAGAARHKPAPAAKKKKSAR